MASSHSIVESDTGAVPRLGLAAGEDGMISLVHTVAVLFCTVLIALVSNVAHLCHQKIELQNAADAVAYTGAVWQARGLNAITATNHVMGEILAFVIVHHAVGGDCLDQNRVKLEDGRYAAEREDRNLDRAMQRARALGARINLSAYRTVRQHERIHAEATLLDSKKELKVWLTRVYRMMAAAEIMKRSPATRAAGEALAAAATVLERLIWNEYRLLKSLHAVAQGLLPVKFLLRDVLLPAASDATHSVVSLVPELAQQTARDIAARNGAEAALFPTNGLGPPLPVEIDPFAVRHLRGGGLNPDWAVKVTQLARATFPWVNYHRQPVLDALNAGFRFCRPGHHYFEFTARYSKQLCLRYQTDSRNLKLYVLKRFPDRPPDHPEPDRGFEEWTGSRDEGAPDPRVADDLFTVVGLAWRPPPVVLSSPAIFRQAHADGLLACAQAMVYNANRQQQPVHRIDPRVQRIIPIRQADTGWDTLNWKEGDPPFELLGIGIPHHFPAIRINWQARRVPLTRNRMQQVKAARHVLGMPFAPVLERLEPDGATSP